MLVGRDLLAHLLQLLLDLRLEMLIGLGGDHVIQLIEVELLQAVHQLGLLTLQGRQALLEECLLVGVALPQGKPQRLENTVVELDGLDDLAELLIDPLLAEVLLGALPPVARAVVVDVFTLLDLCRQRATAMTAGEHPGEGELPGLVDAAVSPLHDGLDPLVQTLGDDRCVPPFVEVPLPEELAMVERVLQEPVDPRLRQGLRVLRVRRQPDLRRDLAEVDDRILACRVKLKQTPHQGSALVIHVQALGRRIVEIANRSRAGIVSLTGLFSHALLDLLAEVVDEVLRHEHLDAVDELLVGPRVSGEDCALFVEMDRDVALLHELVEGHPVLQIPVESIRLLDDGDAAGLAPLEEAAHLLKLPPAGSLGGLDVRELADEPETVGRGVGSGRLDLRRDREALLLLLGADADVEDRLVAIGVGSRCGVLAAALRHVPASMMVQTHVRELPYNNHDRVLEGTS